MSSQTTAQKRRRVEQHLLDRIEEGPLFVKSKFLAEDLALSTREIGAALGRLAEDSTRLDVQKWSYTNATTWRVEARQ
jgi:hypothetical protein